MKEILINTICLICLIGTTAFADNSSAHSPFSFGAGARELALGGAALTTACPVTAPYWNASVLAKTERPSLGVSHDRFYDYFGVVLPTMDIGSFGLGLFQLGTDREEECDSSNLLVDGIYNSRLALYLAYGRSLSRYDIGLALMLEHHSLNGYSAFSSPGLNLSISRRFVLRLNWLPEVAASLNSHNLIKPEIKLADERIKYPYSIDAGVSLKLIPKQKWHHAVTLSTKVTKAERLDPEIALGLEYSVHGLLYLRGGTQHHKFPFGVGLRFKSISFDYAMVDRDPGILHMFSLTAAFGRLVSEKRRIREKRPEAQTNPTTNRHLISLTDSLISCSESDEAIGLMEALSQILWDENSWQRTQNKAEFEHWRETAIVAFSTAEYDLASAALDSALSHFPDQLWWQVLRKELDRELNSRKVCTATQKEPVSKPMSDELLKEVEEAYKNGQKLFKEGKLPQAISQWEKAERLAPNYMSVRQYLVNAYKFVGVELYGRNHLNEAIEVWKKAIILAPDSTEIKSYIERTENELVKLKRLSDE